MVLNVRHESLNLRLMLSPYLLRTRFLKITKQFSITVMKVLYFLNEGRLKRALQSYDGPCTGALGQTNAL